MAIKATVLTRALLGNRLDALNQDLGFDNSPAPGPQFFDVDSDGNVLDWFGAPDPDSDNGPVAAIVFTPVDALTVITPDMLVDWSSINGDPDPSDTEKAVYLSRDLFALVVQSN